MHGVPQHDHARGEPFHQAWNDGDGRTGIGDHRGGEHNRFDVRPLYRFLHAQQYFRMPLGEILVS